MAIITAPPTVASSLQQQLRGLRTPLLPGVSVQMSVYNAMPYLVDAVESILHQTYQDFEFIAVDDGSTDDSLAYLKSVRDPRMKILTQPNRGTAAAGNLGLLHCQREFVARMDADDWSDPHRLELQVDAMRRHRDLAAVGCSFAYFGSDTCGRNIPLPLQHDAILRALMAGDHGMVHGASMMRTALLRQLGGYWEHAFFEDWDLFLRLAETGRLINLPYGMYLYRAHATSLSSSRLNEMRSHYGYAIDAAKRRRDGLPPITLETYRDNRHRRTWWNGINESLDNAALRQYRTAMGEIYSGHPLRGRARLAASAVCSPRRTWQRLARGFAFNHA